MRPIDVKQDVFWKSVPDMRLQVCVKSLLLLRLLELKE